FERDGFRRALQVRRARRACCVRCIRCVRCVCRVCRMRRACLTPPAEVADREPEAPPFLVHAGSSDELTCSTQARRNALLERHHSAAARRLTPSPEGSGGMDVESCESPLQRLIDRIDSKMAGTPVEVGEIT